MRDFLGGAGCDDIAGQERHTFGDVANELVHVMGHAVYGRMLPDLAVYVGLDLGISGIDAGHYLRTDRAEGIKALAAGPLRNGFLLILRT